jgi:hypothetical protein
MFFGAVGGFGFFLDILVVFAQLLMIPLGFLLLGLGLPNPSRHGPLVLGWFTVIFTIILLASVPIRDHFYPSAVRFQSDVLLPADTRRDTAKV